jgi:hypothetical protein
MIDSKPRFLQGVFGFHGAGYDKPSLLDASLTYTVPADKRAQLIYLRAGNSAGGMIYLALMQAGETIVRSGSGLSRLGSAQTCKSFLVLFFKKEQAFF